VNIQGNLFHLVRISPSGEHLAGCYGYTLEKVVSEFSYWCVSADKHYGLIGIVYNPYSVQKRKELTIDEAKRILKLSQI
jgi:hypothetical protein